MTPPEPDEMLGIPEAFSRRFGATCRQVSALIGDASDSLVIDESLLTRRAHRRGWAPGVSAAGLSVSANGTAWMLPAADGWVALNLARADDIALLPAWLGQLGAAAERSAIGLGSGLESEAELPQLAARLADTTGGSPRRRLVDAGRLLGLPIAAVTDPVPVEEPVPDFRIELSESRSGTSGIGRVVDLSSMWAGPLAAQILRHAGAEVIRMESPTRRDGFVVGDPWFYDQLNSGKELRLLDPQVPADLAEIRHEIERADIVMSSSRPRVFEQWGVNPLRIAADGGLWVAITGYGWSGATANAVAFGDDAAVAAGLFGSQDWCGRTVPTFVGDAVADPVTGVTAAAMVLGARRTQRAGFLDVSMVQSVRWHQEPEPTAD